MLASTRIRSQPLLSASSAPSRWDVCGGENRTMNLSKAVRTARAAKGLSQKELAQAAQLDPSYVSLLESGKRNPSMGIVEAIANALDVPLYLLMLFGADDADLRFIDKMDAARLGTHLLAALANPAPPRRSDEPSSAKAMGIVPEATRGDGLRPRRAAKGSR